MIEEQAMTSSSMPDHSDKRIKHHRWYIGIGTLLVISAIAVSIIIVASDGSKNGDTAIVVTQTPDSVPNFDQPTDSGVGTLKDSLIALEDECGVALVNVTGGLSMVFDEFKEMQEILADYTDLSDVGFRHQRGLLPQSKNDDRRLLFGLLVKGVTKFASFAVKKFSFAKKTAVQNGPLSSLADVATIGSTMASLFGGGSNPGSDLEEFKELFGQVFDRFDSIDNQLRNIQHLIQDGFEELSIVINEGFAKQELDNWINFHLNDLMDDYRNYINPDHTPETRRVYEDAFRKSCQDTHAPFTIFRFLYSNTCSSCDNDIGDRSNQYILDTFIDRAKERFPSFDDRVLWFRQSFSTLIIGAMVETYYLHSVCLYQSADVCQNHDPVWLERLDLMSSAMIEAAETLSLSEERLMYPINVALASNGGVATQSSTLLDRGPGRANDGITTGYGDHHSHTNNEVNPWWQVKLADGYLIDEVKVYNRDDGCCDFRIKDFVLEIFVGTNVVYSSSDSAPNESSNTKPLYTFDIPNVMGDTVRIHIPRKTFLHVTEVQVFTTEFVPLNPINVALASNGGVATQSTTHWNGGASLAIDGNTNPNYFGGSMTHTLDASIGGSSNPWWQVVLFDSYNIGQVKVYNREDCCSGRLVGFVLTIIDENGVEVYNSDTVEPSYTNINRSVYSFDMPEGGVLGKTVKVTIPGDRKVLSLAEVEVFTSAVPGSSIP